MQPLPGCAEGEESYRKMMEEMRKGPVDVSEFLKSFCGPGMQRAALLLGDPRGRSPSGKFR